MEVYELQYPESGRKAMELAESGQEGLIVDISDRCWMSVGLTPGAYDAEASEEAGLGDCFACTHPGGACVVFPGDLSLCAVTRQETDLGCRALRAVAAYLGSRGLHLRQAGNDLLLYDPGDPQGRKVASYGSGWAGDDHYQTVLHVSIGMDAALVERVCTKRREKIPGRLDQYGITAQEIWEAIRWTMQ